MGKIVRQALTSSNLPRYKLNNRSRTIFSYYKLIGGLFLLYSLFPFFFLFLLTQKGKEGFVHTTERLNSKIEIEGNVSLFTLVQYIVKLKNEIC